MELTIFIKYISKFGITLKLMLSKPITLIAVSPAIVVPAFTTPQKALILLAGLFIGDFITGIWASWIEFKKALPVTPGSGKRYVIQSSKLRLSAVKFGTYGFMILTGYGLEWAFVPGEFEPHERLAKMTITTFVIAFCCAVEAYSIVFENVKRMGFDVIQKIKNITGVYKSIKKESDANE